MEGTVTGVGRVEVSLYVHGQVSGDRQADRVRVVAPDTGAREGGAVGEADGVKIGRVRRCGIEHARSAAGRRVRKGCSRRARLETRHVYIGRLSRRLLPVVVHRSRGDALLVCRRGAVRIDY